MKSKNIWKNNNFVIKNKSWYKKLNWLLWMDKILIDFSAAQSDWWKERKSETIIWSALVAMQYIWERHFCVSLSLFQINVCQDHKFGVHFD